MANGIGGRQIRVPLRKENREDFITSFQKGLKAVQAFQQLQNQKRATTLDFQAKMQKQQLAEQQAKLKLFQDFGGKNPFGQGAPGGPGGGGQFDRTSFNPFSKQGVLQQGLTQRPSVPGILARDATTGKVFIDPKTGKPRVLREGVGGGQFLPQGTPGRGTASALRPDQRLVTLPNGTTFIETLDKDGKVVTRSRGKVTQGPGGVPSSVQQGLNPPQFNFITGLGVAPGVANQSVRTAPGAGGPPPPQQTFQLSTPTATTTGTKLLDRIRTILTQRPDLFNRQGEVLGAFKDEPGFEGLNKADKDRLLDELSVFLREGPNANS